LPRGSFKFMSLVMKRRVSFILKSFILPEMGQAKPRIQDDAIPIVIPLSKNANFNSYIIYKVIL
jgi:hypothetical protein